MKNSFGLDLLSSSNACDVHCMLPFIVTSGDPVNSYTIVHIVFFRQRFLPASTFLSSSLDKKLAPYPVQSSRRWPTSVAPKSLHSYHHHPSFPPTDVCCLQALLYLLVSSLPSASSAIASQIIFPPAELVSPTIKARR